MGRLIDERGMPPARLELESSEAALILDNATFMITLGCEAEEGA